MYYCAMYVHSNILDYYTFCCPDYYVHNVKVYTSFIGAVQFQHKL